MDLLKAHLNSAKGLDPNEYTDAPYHGPSAISNRFCWSASQAFPEQRKPVGGVRKDRSSPRTTMGTLLRRPIVSALFLDLVQDAPRQNLCPVDPDETDPPVRPTRQTLRYLGDPAEDHQTHVATCGRLDGREFPGGLLRGHSGKG